MAIVLIIGASRGIGLATVNAALKAGYSVHALSRSASAIRFHNPKLEEKMDGDAVDRDTISRALAGVDAVIQTLGVTPAQELIFTGTRLFSAATQVLVRAMEWRLILCHAGGLRGAPVRVSAPLALPVHFPTNPTQMYD